MKIEIRADSVLIDGYVNIPGRSSKVIRSVDGGKFIEQIEPGAFRRALDTNPDTLVLFNHDDNRVLGRATDENINLREDNIGLRCTMTLTDEKIIQKARANELRGWSFGFIAQKDHWTDPDPSGVRHRTVRSLLLHEVSLLDKAPAYLATSVELRTEEMVETRAAEDSPEITVQSEPGEDWQLKNCKKIIEILERK